MLVVSAASSDADGLPEGRERVPRVQRMRASPGTPGESVGSERSPAGTEVHREFGPVLKNTAIHADQTPSTIDCWGGAKR